MLHLEKDTCHSIRTVTYKLGNGFPSTKSFHSKLKKTLLPYFEKIHSYDVHDHPKLKKGIRK
jgi:hypothetical protein